MIFSPCILTKLMEEHEVYVAETAFLPLLRISAALSNKAKIPDKDSR